MPKDKKYKAYKAFSAIFIAVIIMSVHANAETKIKISPELREKIERAKIHRADLIEDQIRREIREEGLRERNDRMREEARERRKNRREYNQ